MDFNVTIQSLDFSISLSSIFGNNVNHLLNVFGPLQSGTLTDETGAFYLGETYEVAGRTLEMVGSGFAIPGISVLGLIVPTGFPVDVMVMQDVDTGQNFFVYPNGTPNILSAIALVTNTSAEPYSASFAGAPPVCFCTGTRLATPEGPRPVESLLPGDAVLTLAGESRRVLWAGGKVHPVLAPEQRPIVFRAGALGPGLPARDLRLSPHHRLLLGPEGTTPRRLGPASAFTGLPGVRQETRPRAVGYFHILLERHDAVLAEGVAVESLLLGSQACKMLGANARTVIAGVLGCDEGALSSRPEAQPCGRLLGPNQTRRKIGKIALEQGLAAIVQGRPETQDGAPMQGAA